MSSLPAATVYADLVSWRARFEAGDIRVRGLFQPKLAPGERLAGQILRVHLVVGDSAEQADFGPSLAPDTDGAAWVTSQRLLIRGNGRRIARAWPWTELAAVQVLRIGIGVQIDERHGGRAALGSVWHRTVPGSRPDARELYGHWLQVEAAYVATEGAVAMDRWFAALPERLGASLEGW